MIEEIISFTIIPKIGDPITWFLKMLYGREDTEYMQRFTQIADKKGDELAEAEYKIYVDSLIEWSAKMPTRRCTVESEPDPETGKTTKEEKEVPLGEGNLKTAITEYFAERSASKEWMATITISTFRNAHYPSAVFHKHSE